MVEAEYEAENRQAEGNGGIRGHGFLQKTFSKENPLNYDLQLFSVGKLKDCNNRLIKYEALEYHFSMKHF